MPFIDQNCVIDRTNIIRELKACIMYMEIREITRGVTKSKGSACYSSSYTSSSRVVVV